MQLNKQLKWQLFVDGASRNNPGLSGAGIYLAKEHKKEVALGFFLGIKTNNQAEYLALLIGVVIALPKIKSDHLQIKSDSLLLVNQLNGIYQVKNPELKLLHRKALNLLAPISYEIVHVLRAENEVADKLANLGIDHKIALSPDIKKELNEVSI